MKQYGELTIKLVGAYCPANDRAFKKFGVKYQNIKSMTDEKQSEMVNDIYEVALSFIREVYKGAQTIDKDEVLYMPSSEANALWLDIASIASLQSPELAEMIKGVLVGEVSQPKELTEEKKS